MTIEKEKLDALNHVLGKIEKDFMEIRDKLIFIAENGGLVFEKGEVIFKDEKW